MKTLSRVENFENATNPVTCGRFENDDIKVRKSPTHVERRHGSRLILLIDASSTRRLHRRSLRLPTRSKSAQTGHLCTTAQAGADPGIFVCRSKFPGLKVGT